MTEDLFSPFILLTLCVTLYINFRKNILLPKEVSDFFTNLRFLDRKFFASNCGTYSTAYFISVSELNCQPLYNSVNEQNT